MINKTQNISCYMPSSLLHSRVLLVPLVHLLLLVAGAVGPAVPLVELGFLGLPEHLNLSYFKLSGWSVFE